jgi:site-specific DNA-adenine methylase
MTAFDRAWDIAKRGPQTPKSRGVKSPFDTAWGVTKGIIFGGRNYDDIDEVSDLISEIIGDVNRKRPELPWKKGSGTPAGPRRGTPWTAMREAKLEGRNLNEPFHSLRGFTDSSEMLPTVLNWEGGKTQIQPQMRAISQSLGRETIPAELFGGSGSFILGQNKGKGLYSDINPDVVTVMRHLKAGMTIPHIPQNQDELEEMVSELNDLRRRRDVLGEDLDFDEERRLAQAFVGANLQHRNGMFNFGDWDEEPVRHTEGFIKKPSFRRTKHPVGHKDHRWFPSDVGSVDLRPYASRLKDVDIHEGDFRESAKHLTRHHNLYLDPQYISRDIGYGGSSQQQEGKEFDQMQRDVIRIGREHEGPSIISNYMYDKNTRKPLYGYIDELMDSGYDIHPWLRKPKGTNLAQAELLALRGFPKQLDLTQDYSTKGRR